MLSGIPLVSIFGESFKAVVRKLSDSIEAGIDCELASFVDETLPDALFELGRKILEGVLSQFRGFTVSRLTDKASNELNYQGDRPRRILTKFGHIHVQRAYYLGAEGGKAYSVYPLDLMQREQYGVSRQADATRYCL